MNPMFTAEAVLRLFNLGVSCRFSVTNPMFTAEAVLRHSGFKYLIDYTMNPMFTAEAVLRQPYLQKLSTLS